MWMWLCKGKLISLPRLKLRGSRVLKLLNGTHWSQWIFSSYEQQSLSFHCIFDFYNYDSWRRHNTSFSGKEKPVISGQKWFCALPNPIWHVTTTSQHHNITSFVYGPDNLCNIKSLIWYGGICGPINFMNDHLASSSVSGSLLAAYETCLASPWIFTKIRTFAGQIHL